MKNKGDNMIFWFMGKSIAAREPMIPAPHRYKFHTHVHIARFLIGYQARTCPLPIFYND
jgi:hypothetical protein